jgi:hypothetical protein
MNGIHCILGAPIFQSTYGGPRGGEQIRRLGVLGPVPLVPKYLRFPAPTPSLSTAADFPVKKSEIAISEIKTPRSRATRGF